MSNENKEIENILLNAGYKLHRHGKRHPIYKSENGNTITLPNGKITSTRFRHWIRSQIRRNMISHIETVRTRN